MFISHFKLFNMGPDRLKSVSAIQEAPPGLLSPSNVVPSTIPGSKVGIILVKTAKMLISHFKLHNIGPYPLKSVINIQGAPPGLLST